MPNIKYPPDEKYFSSGGYLFFYGRIKFFPRYVNKITWRGKI